MGKDRLEEYIKDQIHDHRSEVNPDAIWAAIQPPVKKKRRPFWLLGLFGILFVSAFVVYNFWSGTFNKLADKQIIETQNLIVDADKETLISTPITQSQEDEPSTPTTIEKKTTSITKSKESTTTLIQENKTQAVQNNPIATIDNTSSSAKSQQLKTRNPQDIRPSSSHNHSAKANTKTLVETGLMSKAAPTKSLAFIDQNANVIGKTKNNKQASLVPLSISLLENQTIQIQFNRSIRPEFLTVPLIDKPLENLKENKPSAWQVSGTYAYYLGSRNLSSSSDTTLLESRKSHEQFMEAWELGALVGYNHSSGLRLETGISYTQINDRTINSLIEERFIHPQPVSFDRSIIKEVTTINQHRYHKIRMIDIPVHLSYGMTKGKWSIRPGAGINLNLRTSGSGNISGLDSLNANLIDVSTVNYFESNIGYNMEARLQLDYHFSDQLSINLSSSYKHYPNSFTVGSIAQKYKLWGIKMGLSKRF